jgi:hypothetical protein
MKISNLNVQIVRFVDEHQPGWVACEFQDVEGHRHTVIDKVPILTNEDLRADSAYPKPGTLPCEVLDQWKDSNGAELARISTRYPLDDQSIEGLSEFVVAATQLSPGAHPRMAGSRDVEEEQY